MTLPPDPEQPALDASAEAHGNGPLFLARTSYRRRRLMDAARLLPILGLVLVLMPVLWGSNTDGAGSTARAAIYLFTVWVTLIVLAALLARRLSDPLGPKGAQALPEDDP